MEQARQQATDRLQEQKQRTADGVTGMAQAVRQTGQSLRTSDQTALAGYADQAADQLERLSGYLRRHDVQDLIWEVEGFARRRPAAFIGLAFGAGFLAARFLKSSQRAGGGGMGGAGMGRPSTDTSVEVDAPVTTVYNQWTQFEAFPRFMEGVEQVRQLDDKRLHWKARIAGKAEEWDAVITEQIPDRRIAWRSTTGARNDGVVTFYPLGPGRTRVQLRLDYQPEGPIEGAGSALGLVDRRIEGDLNRFKEFIEGRGAETGAWRGEVRNENLVGSPNPGGVVNG
jgi:uncharacterized membrane protein